MKIQLLAATALLTMLTATSASAGKLNIDTYNNATNSVAVGDAVGIAVAGGPGGIAGTLALAAGSRAEAGSVLVNAVGRKCNCYIDVKVRNTSENAVAVGSASAGSTAIRL